jgi:predicted amidohydrolase
VEKCGIYAVVGFAESAGDKFYNSAAVISDKGDVHTYRKIHLFGREGLFFARGDKPLVFDTPWGKTSVGICYDTYNFPELLRYYAYKGARLYLNPTAMAFECYAEGAKESFCNYYKTTLEYNVINTGMFIVSSDLTGIDKTSRFGGGSVIMGICESDFKRPKVKYYAGDIKNEAEGMFTAEIDLSQHNPRLFVPSPITGEVDFRPELYAKFYE